MRSRLHRTLSKKLNAFCDHSTLHGVYYLKKGKGTVVLWSVIIVAGFTLWAVLGHMIYEKYSSDPIVTVVESTYYGTDQIPFPSFMICPSWPLYGPNTGNISHILHSRGYSASEMNDFFDSFVDINDVHYKPKLHVRKMHALLQDLGFTMEILLEMFKKPCGVTLVRCRWWSMEFKCSEMFVEVFTFVGHCCQFDVDHFKRSAPFNTKFVPGNTVSQGLEITVNGLKDYANGSVLEGAVMMYIFDPNYKVTGVDSPISLAPSSYFEVEIDIFAIDASPEVEAMPLKTRKCSLSTDRAIGASFYQNCLATLVMRKVVNLCKCLPFLYSAEELSVEDYPSCTWERYLCIIPQKEVTYADLHSLIRMNDCYQSCDYVEYDPKVEFLRKLENAKNNNYTKLGVHYASRTCMKFRREIIYTWDQMLANLGGIFGLCLGGSFLSLIEIVGFLIDILVTTIKSYISNKKKDILVNEKDKKHGRNENGYYKFTN